MRREGRQHGWVFTVDRSLVDPEGKCRRRAVTVEGAATANGGFVRAPRKPTNHSKPAVGRACGGKACAASGKGTNKFEHDEVKMYYLEEADDDVYDLDASKPMRMEYRVDVSSLDKERMFIASLQQKSAQLRLCLRPNACHLGLHH
ncbi:hypothetical protein EJB05_17152, partial [Eragrostis curvula]